MDEVLAQVKPALLKRLPIRVINFSDKTDKARHDNMVKLVKRMLKLHQDLKAEWVGDPIKKRSSARSKPLTTRLTASSMNSTASAKTKSASSNPPDLISPTSWGE